MTKLDEITCPFCGWKNNDSWEYGQGHSIYQCGNCEKNSSLNVNISVDYSTSIIECLNDESKHDWKPDGHYEPINGKQYSRCKKCYENKWVQEQTDKMLKGEK